MSRRKRRPSGAPTASGGKHPAARPAGRRIPVDLAVLVAVFGATTGIAELAGAVNLGTALGVGQVAFALAVVVMLLRE